MSARALISTCFFTVVDFELPLENAHHSSLMRREPRSPRQSMVAKKVPCSLPRCRGWSVIFRHQLRFDPERQADAWRFENNASSPCRSISSWSFATIFDGLDQVLNVSGMGGMGTSPNTATFASVFMAILRSRCGQHHCRPSSLGDGEAPMRAIELSPRGQAVKIPP